MSLPPPPPPLPIVTSIKSKSVQDPEDVVQVLKKWVERENLRRTTFVVGWSNIPSVLQNGPQCGLVALCMAAQSLGVSVTTESLFTAAIDRGMTKQGEMFSATALANLAENFHLQASVIDWGLSNVHQILELLMDGKLLLVPYDADRDHRPCTKKGHKAHWAILIGYFVKSSADAVSEHECLEDNLYRINGKSNSVLLKDIDKSNVYFLAKHGKSKWTAIWSYQQLEESNKNLEEVDPQRRDEREYVLPAGAKLIKDLCGKIICVSKNNL